MNNDLPPYGTAEYYKAIGSRGGRATKAKHGSAHFSEAGKKGFQATTERYFNGDEAAHKQWLGQRGAYNYWLSSSLTMKYGPDGKPLWPRSPIHPAQQEIPF